MARYHVTRDYRSGQHGPWDAGSEVELDPVEAAYIHRDSPGALEATDDEGDLSLVDPRDATDNAAAVRSAAETLAEPVHTREDGSLEVGVGAGERGVPGITGPDRIPSTDTVTPYTKAQETNVEHLTRTGGTQADAGDVEPRRQVDGREVTQEQLNTDAEQRERANAQATTEQQDAGDTPASSGDVTPGQPPTPDVTTGDVTTGPEPRRDADGPYDPSQHNADEVKAYLADADDQERERVLAAERAGRNRKGVVGE